MKIFLLGDIHGEWEHADQSYENATAKWGSPDLLIQVGDFGYYPTGVGYKVWHRNDFGHRCVFIDGNHEMHEALRAVEGKIDGCWEYARRGWHESGMLGIGGATSVDKAFRLKVGAHWSDLEDLTREEVDPILDANYEDVKVVISHTCPSGFDMAWACNPMWGGEHKDEITRVLLQEVLEKYKPEVWVFGHWHVSGSGTYHHEDGTTTEWQCLDIAQMAKLELSDDVLNLRIEV